MSIRVTRATGEGILDGGHEEAVRSEETRKIKGTGVDEASSAIELQNFSSIHSCTTSGRALLCRHTRRNIIHGSLTFLPRLRLFFQAETTCHALTLTF